MGVIQEGINRGLGLTALGLQQDKKLQENVQHNINVEKAQKLINTANEVDNMAKMANTIDQTPVSNEDGVLTLGVAVENKDTNFVPNKEILRQSENESSRLRNEAIRLDPTIQNIRSAAISTNNYYKYNQSLNKSYSEYMEQKMNEANQEAQDKAELAKKQRKTYEVHIDKMQKAEIDKQKAEALEKNSTKSQTVIDDQNKNKGGKK